MTDTTETKTAEEKEQTAIAVRSSLEMTPTGLVLTNLDEMYRFAQYVSASPFAPKDMRDPVSIVVAIQYGAELGLSMMAALANIAVINGKPSIYGDAMLALVRASGLLQEFSEGLVVKVDGKLACTCAKWAREGECIHSRAAIIPFSRPGEERVGVCFAHRKGTAEGNLRTFGVVDAKIAGLWGKSGPWSTAPDRMLMFRPRGFVLRDEFSDVLKGLISREEAMDFSEPPAPTKKKLKGTLKERLAAPKIDPEPEAIDAEEEPTTLAEIGDLWPADIAKTENSTVEAAVDALVEEIEEATEKVKMETAAKSLSKVGLDLIKKGLQNLTPTQRDDFFEAFQISKVSALQKDQWQTAMIWIDKRTIYDEKDEESAPIVQQDTADDGPPWDDDMDAAIEAGEIITDEQVAQLVDFAETKGLTGEQLDVVRGWLEVSDLSLLHPSLFDRAMRLVAIIAKLKDPGRMQTALKHYGAASVLTLTDENLNHMLAKLAGGGR